MISLKGYKEELASLPNEIKEAEVNAERISRTTLYIKDGSLVNGEASTITKLYVRATGEKTGTAYTEKLDEASGDVIMRAYMNSQYSGNDVPQIMNGCNDAHFPCAGSADTIDSAVGFGAAAEQIAKGNDSVESVTGCVVALCLRQLYTINSHGLDTSYESRWSEGSLNVKMKRNSGYIPGYAYQSAGMLDHMDAGKLAAAAACDGDVYDGGGLAPCEVEPGSYDAVLSGRVMRNILMTAWMEFSGTGMLEGKSIFTNKEGTRIGSKALNIINTPSHPMLGQAWLIDSEGTICKKTQLVKNGSLITPLYTLGSGSLAGKASTGSAGRIDRMTGSIPISLTTVPAIFYIEPGDNGQEELISRMGTGMLLTYSLDLFHSVNLASGEFSIPCGGVYYENGKPVGSVSQMTIAGNLRDLFSNIDSVADDLDFDDFYLKSYTIGSPSALVRNLTFSS